ncbi:hypothetical protein VTK73DRAFT_4021 [Phialemonium thermophilum]|uniref:Uncharacterized protein n=1 Tax=Phialemonium thermophilum TaxID=223376 RepID=A0ABR3VCC9_9PEZI
MRICHHHCAISTRVSHPLNDTQRRRHQAGKECEVRRAQNMATRIHRVTLFKVPDPENQKKLLEAYEVLKRDQKKFRLLQPPTRHITCRVMAVMASVRCQQPPSQLGVV